MNTLKKTFIIVLTAVWSLTAASCSSSNDNALDVSSSASSQTDSSASVKPSPSDVHQEIIGQWGRLDEVLHYFTADGRCIIGGIQGSYRLDDSCTLILTDFDGNITEYEWASSKSEASSSDYWYLENDTLTVNGNKFSKIYGQETPDYAM